MERRRLLGGIDYLEWIKSLTCQFYAPLDNGNGLTDLISGQVGVQQNNNTAVWDNAEQAYLMTKDASTSPYGQSIVRWSGLDMQYNISDIGFTILYEIKVVKWGNNSNGVSTDGFIVPLVLGGRTLAVNAANMGIQLNQWAKIALVYPQYNGVPRYSRQYKNGVEMTNYYRGTTVYSGNANTNIMMDTGRCFDTYSLGYTDCQYYLRNAYAFTAALDIDTIKQIQHI